jgi:hypothetical protein
MVSVEAHPRGAVLSVRAHAGAGRNGILGEREGMLRVAVTEAPEKGKANKAIIAVLSKALGVAKSSIEIVSGETSARKRFLLVGANANELRAKIAELLAA